MLLHTGQLPPDLLTSTRTLLESVFDDFDLPGWHNTLGGMHALTFDGPHLVGHAALVQRRLLHDGRVLNTGYVEGVAVHPAYRRRGIAGALMGSLEELLRGYDVGALSASSDGAPMYASRGWQVWRGPTFALTPGGVRRTADEDGGIYVFPGREPLDLDGELVADWRAGEVW
ncbi:GNAT family N-acetyltransferase [Amycolatopsis sp. OK19-0408]|uniref:GNAT family N-acetyltransferase n=1 Tax=Amycolatopsis iheyensis TaxID=2945988 RepID=A0A9X2SLZ6_9PSEU|nr:GNAT family N-acetyltransferase [Amycolatopsis iheyensis]MCR6487044.1 GNAT family N-acetyltransferase [Amycolatopsis iheyensis]